MRANWSDVAFVLEMLKAIFSDEGRNPPPPAGSAEPPELGRELDAAIRALVRNLDEENLLSLVGPSQRPWLVARLVMAGAACKREAAPGENPPSGPLEKILTRVLVDEWHLWMKQKWASPRHDDQSFDA